MGGGGERRREKERRKERETRGDERKGDEERERARETRGEVEERREGTGNSKLCVTHLLRLKPSHVLFDGVTEGMVRGHTSRLEP